MKTLLWLVIVIGSLSNGLISSAWAYTGWCTPQTSTKIFSYDFGTMNVSDVSKNKAGTSFKDAYVWNLGGSYYALCDSDPAIKDPLFYYSSTTLLPPGHSDGTLQYYKVNDYLEVASSIWLAGTTLQYVPTPWNDITSGAACGVCATYHTPEEVLTGSQGKLSLYIAKPFVGTVTIPSTNIVKIRISTVKGSYSTEPLSSVFISGQVVVPQTCTINAGNIITVDFGQLWAGDFNKKGEQAGSQSDKTVTVPIKCNNMDAQANMTLRFHAQPSADEPNAIKTSNDNVGVIVKDDKGNVIPPNSGTLPFILDDNLSAEVTFHLEPISTTGLTPDSGTFQAQAYLRIDFA